MEKDRYIQFSTVTDAAEFIREIDEIIGEHWAEPEVHPFDSCAVVPWNDSYLKKAEHLLAGKTSITRHEAIDKGWTFSFYKGRFGKARTKLEDALFARDSLDLFDGYANFPAYRAVFVGILVSLYGVKEALRNACARLGDEPRRWWEDKFQEIQSKKLLKLCYDMHNIDKHGLVDSTLHPTTRFYGYKGPAPDIISGEGVFSIINRGKKNERRIFHPGAKVELECFILMPDGGRVAAKGCIDEVIDHYRTLVWEAREKFGD